MASYLFFSHDGYGLGHVRRNCVIAEAVRRVEPNASVTLVTGIPSHPRWLERWQPNVVRVPPLLKDRDGRYRPLDMSFEEAIAHIRRHGSGLAEAIVTRDIRRARRFTQQVDAAAVLVNASTRLVDGSAFGMGAEMGISTSKLHARGPVGVRELTTTKFVVWGDGHLRE